MLLLEFLDRTLQSVDFALELRELVGPLPLAASLGDNV